MKYLILALGVFFFTIYAIFSYEKNSNETVKNNKQKLKPEGLNFNTGWLDSFTMAEVNRAIQHAHEEYGTPKVPWKVQDTDSVREAVDIVKGEYFFTRVALSKGGDTLYVFSTEYESTNSPDKSLYDVVLDELVDYKYKVKTSKH